MLVAEYIDGGTLSEILMDLSIGIPTLVYLRFLCWLQSTLMVGRCLKS